ncbi:50S ribosomal protein L4 [Patescibacteria group bacterium]|nr:50S ribosomal protein L4 [Patescibacteria group bacterium]
MKLTKVNLTGANSSLTASDAVFGSVVNETLLAQAVRVYLSNKRQGTSYTKTRSEVNRTKKKWYKQKGTGNARHGARSANIFVGGGTAHGPKGNTDWTLKLTAVLKKKAMISALSAQASKVIVSDDIMNLSGKTKEAAALITKVAPEAGKVLVVINKSEENVLKSLRNLETVLVVSASRVNTLEIVLADAVIMTSEAVKALEARLLGEVKEVKEEKSAVKATAVKTTKKVAAKKAA